MGGIFHDAMSDMPFANGPVNKMNQGVKTYVLLSVHFQTNKRVSYVKIEVARDVDVLMIKMDRVVDLIVTNLLVLSRE